jgi:tetratricopeptide (TPR) repeat protein
MAMALATLVLPAAKVAAQDASNAKLYTKDNKELLWKDITMAGEIMGWKTKNPQTGGDMVVNIPASNVAKMDFPEPPDLQEALTLLSHNKPDEAAAKAAPIVQQFAPFKSVVGSWYPAASMVQLEALAQKKDVPAYDKLRGDLKTINLGPTDMARLSTIDAMQDYLKGVVGPALVAVDKIIPTTEDTSVLGKLYLLKGDIQFKRGNFSEALEAYLHLPVFYGTQSAYLPNAELGAARSLQKMARLDDALDMYKAILERYKGEPQAKAAEVELDNIAKALGKSSDADATGAVEKTEKAEGEKADAPKAGDAPKADAPKEDAPKTEAP